ncbi:MAG: hypothetical protein ACRCST_03435 [Turicibacter sp.]
MMGFISALSSAVAIMVLIMSVLLVKKVDVEKFNDLLRSRGLYINDSEVEHTSSQRFLKSLIISDNEIEYLSSRGKGMVITCTYGGSRLKGDAEKFLVFNYIKIIKALKSSNSKPDVEMSIIFDEKKNSCFINFK